MKINKITGALVPVMKFRYDFKKSHLLAFPKHIVSHSISLLTYIAVITCVLGLMSFGSTNFYKPTEPHNAKIERPDWYVPTANKEHSILPVTGPFPFTRSIDVLLMDNLPLNK